MLALWQDEDHHIIETKGNKQRKRKRSTESGISRQLTRKLSRKLSLKVTRKLTREDTIYDLDDENEQEEAIINNYSRLTTLKRLLGFNKEDWPVIVIVLISATFAGCGFPIFGFFWGTIYDIFITTDPSEVISRVDPWGASFIGLGIMMGTAYLFKVSDQKCT